jgi:hypothetical protein
MKVIKLDSKYWSDLPEQVTAPDVMKEVERGTTDAAKLLEVSEHLNVIVIPNLLHVIDVTGTGASTWGSELIDFTFDPKRAGETGFMMDVYASMFHELNHAAGLHAGMKQEGYLEQWVFEGLATVFEREYTDYEPKWGKYNPKETKAWLAEVQGMNEKLVGIEYWFKHPDGRRWIGYKVGTWIVDEAIKNSGKDILELTVTPRAEILKLSKVL